MDIKELIKKNLLTILSAVAIISLFFTFISISTESSYTGEITTKYTGLQACEVAKLGYLLILGPVLLIVMNYIKALEKYKGMLSMTVPCVCLGVLIITFFLAKAGVQSGGEAGSQIMESVGVDIDVSSSIGLGTVFAALSYVAMIIFGVKTQKDFTISKPNLNGINIDMDNVKAAGAEFLKNAQILPYNESGDA